MSIVHFDARPIGSDLSNVLTSEEEGKCGGEESFPARALPLSPLSAPQKPAGARTRTLLGRGDGDGPLLLRNLRRRFLRTVLCGAVGR